MDGDTLMWGINLGEAAKFSEEMISGRIPEKRSGDFWLVAQPYWMGKIEYGVLENYFNSNFILAEKKDYPFEGIRILRFKPKNPA